MLRIAVAFKKKKAKNNYFEFKSIRALLNRLKKRKKERRQRRFVLRAYTKFLEERQENTGREYERRMCINRVALREGRKRRERGINSANLLVAGGSGAGRNRRVRGKDAVSKSLGKPLTPKTRDTESQPRAIERLLGTRDL